jgi:hypothetical protein
VRLTDEELRDVLTRAEEIQRATRTGPAAQKELEAVIGAAEEIGLERSAVERALRERLALPLAPPGVGSLTLARSTDDKYYVAEVVSVTPDNIRVRFLRGSENDVTLDQLRPIAFNPGERLTVDWPMWGQWTCTVVSYDAARRRVELSDGWGETRSFPIDEVWVKPKREENSLGRRRVYVTLVGAGAAIGAVIGSLITALLMR